jgi:hypothetical protein
MDDTVTTTTTTTESPLRSHYPTTEDLNKQCKHIKNTTTLL